MEDLITKFELVGIDLLRICAARSEMWDNKYELREEQAVLRAVTQARLSLPLHDRKTIELCCLQGRSDSQEETPDYGTALIL